MTQQQRKQLIQDANEEKSRLLNLYFSKQISKDRYTEESERLNSKINNLKAITSFFQPSSQPSSQPSFQPSSQPTSSKLSYYDSIVTTEDEAREKLGLRDTGNGTWTHESLINDPYGHYKRKAEKERKTRKEKLAPYGKTLPEGSRYFYDHWQAPLVGVDVAGNKTITGWSQIPDESYVNKTPTVQTPQLNYGIQF
jgi:hypothetical protein